MDRFPRSISAARVASFVSTAAWIQGSAASDVSLPEEALNNFLKRHGVRDVTTRQDDTASPPEEEEEGESAEGESQDSVESVSDDGDASSSDESSLSGASDEEEEGEEDEDPAAVNTNQAGVAVDGNGQPVIESSEPPALSTGAQAAIGIWSAVAVVAIASLIYFFYRRRQKKMMMDEMRSVEDMEAAKYQAMSEQGAAPSVMEPAHLRGGGGGSRPGSGRWMPTPPWQEDSPTWRDSQPFRQSRPILAPNGLPINPSPRAQPARSVAGETADTESTIFAYR